MSDCRKCAEFDWCVENEDCGLFKPKPQTNYDRIISKTPEELALFLNELSNGDCPTVGDCPEGLRENETCTPWQCWLYWLKAPVEEEVDNG